MLVLSYSGGMTGEQKRYILYGDGRLDMQHRSHTDELLERRERMLSYEDMRMLLEIAVQHGLMECTSDELAKHLPRVTDAADMSATISLEHHTREDGSPGPLTSTMRVSDPLFFADRLPADRELQALVELTRLAKSLWRDAGTVP